MNHIALQLHFTLPSTAARFQIMNFLCIIKMSSLLKNAFKSFTLSRENDFITLLFVLFITMVFWNLSSSSSMKCEFVYVLVGGDKRLRRFQKKTFMLFKHYYYMHNNSTFFYKVMKKT